MIDDTTLKTWVYTSSVSEEAPTGTRPTLMVTWAIKQPFGGMTTMCLKRASMFHERGIPSAVVTFDPEPDYQSIRQSLVSSGQLHASVPIVNLHDYYSQILPEHPASAIEPTDTRSPDWIPVGEVRRPNDKRLFYKDYSVAENKELKRREYFRADGTLYLLDCTLPVTADSSKLRRVLQLFRRGRTPVAEFSSAAKLYRHWLSAIVGSSETDVIVDSKYSAAFLGSWNHPGATKVFNFHSTHVRAGQDSHTGTLSRAHKEIIDQRASWDALVFLTESQRSAFVGRFGDQGNTFVIGNPAEGPQELPNRSKRDLTKVVFVGRLALGKNVDQVIEIMDIVSRTGQPITLDIIGDGEQRGALEQQVKDLGLENKVNFLGHVDSVDQHLIAANILLLCSSFEGQSLAILEAQAHGCVPVAYDVDFGPRDVIEHGVTGYLVPYKDMSAAAGIVIRLLGDDNLSSAISNKAFERAEIFDEDSTFLRWQQSLTTVRENRLTLAVLNSIKPVLKSLQFLPENGLSIEVHWPSDELEFDGMELMVIPRGITALDKVATIIPSEIGNDRATFIIPDSIRRTTDKDVPLDLNIRLISGASTVSVRLGAPSRQSLMTYFTIYGNLSIK